jgi:hypothetical protein
LEGIGRGICDWRESRERECESEKEPERVYRAVFGVGKGMAHKLEMYNLSGPNPKHNVFERFRSAVSATIKPSSGAA